MFKEDLVEALKKKLEDDCGDATLFQAVAKLMNDEKLTSEEFSEIYQTIRKEGPQIKYVHPENWDQTEEEQEDDS